MQKPSSGDIKHNFDNDTQVNPSSELESKPKFFEVINPDTIESLKQKIEERLGIKIPNLNVITTRPGDNLFTTIEARYKLTQQVGGEDKFTSLLETSGYPKKFTDVHSEAEAYKTLAKSSTVILDGKVPGFLLSEPDNSLVIFLAIREDEVINMANKYAKKDSSNKKPTTKFDNLEEAKKYLSEFAQRGFPHEIGHIIFRKLLTPETKLQWKQIVGSNTALIKRVIEVQSDKYANVTDIPIPEEAFADLFSGLVAGESAPTLGQHPEEEQELKKILQSLNIKL